MTNDSIQKLEEILSKFIPIENLSGFVTCKNNNVGEFTRTGAQVTSHQCPECKVILPEGYTSALEQANTQILALIQEVEERAEFEGMIEALERAETAFTHEKDPQQWAEDLIDKLRAELKSLQSKQEEKSDV